MQSPEKTLELQTYLEETENSAPLPSRLIYTGRLQNWVKDDGSVVYVYELFFSALSINPDSIDHPWNSDWGSLPSYLADAIAYYSQRANRTNQTVLAATYADAAFSLGKLLDPKKRHRDGALALSKYIQFLTIALGHPESQHYELYKYVQRAIAIARELNLLGAEQRAQFEALAELVFERLGCYEALQWFEPLKDKLDNFYPRIVERCAQRFIADAANGTKLMSTQVEIFEMLLPLARRFNLPSESIIDALVQMAHNFGPDSGLLASGLFQRAVDAARSVGESGILPKLESLMVDAGAVAKTQMVAIPRYALYSEQSILDFVAALHDIDRLPALYKMARVACEVIIAVRDAIEEPSIQGSVLLDFVTPTIMDTSYMPKSNSRLALKLMLNEDLDDFVNRAGLAMRHLGKFAGEELADQIETLCNCPAEHKQSAARLMQAFTTEDYMFCCYLAPPLIEAAMRAELRRFPEFNTRKLNDVGGVNDKTLGEIIGMYQELAIKSGYLMGDALRNILLEDGLNLRNRFLHGQMSDNSCNLYYATLLVGVWLAVTSTRFDDPSDA